MAKQDAPKTIELPLNYWKTQLEGSLPILQLPTDYSCSQLPTFSERVQSFELSLNLSQDLQNLSAQQGVTPFITLLAAFKTLLYRYSTQEDIIVGIPSSPYSSVLTTLPIRTRVSEDLSFRQFLSQVQEVTGKAYEHSDSFSDTLIKELQPDLEAKTAFFSQVMFNLQNQLVEETTSEIESSQKKWDLTLNLKLTKKGIHGELKYNTNLFQEATIARMVGHFQTLLEGIVATPDKSLSHLPLLTTAEEHQILVEWNNTSANYPDSKCIHQLFEEQVELTPNAVAVIFENQQLTYQQLNHLANQLAHYLKQLGVKSEVTVGIALERSLKMLIAMLAVLKAGGAYIPVDPTYPQERKAFMLSDSSTAILLTQTNLVDKLFTDNTQVICLDEDWEIISQQPSANVTTIVSPSNLAYIIYTSGSTGKPKGVQITHGSVVNFLTGMQQNLQLNETDYLLSVTTISFDIAVLELFLPLTVGSKIILVTKDVASNGIELLEQLESFPVTILQATPATWRMLLESGWKGNCRLKILCGGEALSQNLAQELSARSGELWNVYGPTETTVWSTSNLLNQQTDLISIGRPIINTQIYILDKYLQPVPIGVAGELHIGGAGLARGYLNRSELTAEKFIPNPFLVDTQQSKVEASSINTNSSPLLYKTGDLARYLPDGKIECLGRIDHQVKIRGFRIELGEIEAEIAKHPQVKQSVVVAREDNPGDKRLVSYIICQQAKTVTSKELKEFLKEELPNHMIPSAFVFLDSLPLTPNGKIDRRALPAPQTVQKSQSEEALVTPRNQIEEKLTKIWEKVLKIQSIGVQDNFFDLGGHSLTAVSMFVQIKEQLGQNLPLSILFDAPTIEQLSVVLQQKEQLKLERSLSATASNPSNSSQNPAKLYSLVTIQPQGSLKPLFGVHTSNYRPLASYLSVEQPVYALRYGLAAQITDNIDELPNRIEDLATHYIEEMQTVQPNGPYFLMGLSLGGVIAFEMAQQLVSQGQKVGLLILFDTAYPGGARKLSLFQKIAKILRLPKRELFMKLMRRVKMELNKLRSTQSDRYSPYVPADEERFFLPYHPQPYQGKAIFIHATNNLPSISHDFDPPELNWGKLISEGLEIYDVKGDHTGILEEPYVEAVAEKIRLCLENA